MVTIHGNHFRLPDPVLGWFSNVSGHWIIGGVDVGELRLYLSDAPEELDSPEVIDWRKFFSQGEEYPFNGHNVRHLKLIGDIFPTNITKAGGYYISRASNGMCHVWSGPDGALLRHDGYCLAMWHQLHFDDGDYFIAACENLFSTGRRVVTTSIVASKAIDYDARGRSYTLRRNGPRLSWIVEPLGYDGDRFHDFRRVWSTISEADFEEPYRWGTRNYGPIPVGDISVSKYHLRKEGGRVLNAFWNQPLTSWLTKPEDTSYLVKTCLDGQRQLTVNMLNWVDKLTGWGAGVKALTSLADNFTAKGLASAWLSNRFGDRLEYGSSLEVLDALWDAFLTVPIPNKYSRTHVSRAACSGQAMGGQYDRHMRLVTDNESYTSLMTSVKGLMSWGIWPGLQNTFDLIPFSFVLDWFTNLSTILENVDELVYKQYLRVMLCEQSWRWKRPVELTGPEDTCWSNIYIQYYERHGGLDLPEFGILEGWEPSLPSPVNFVDSMALLVQLVH